MKTDLDQLKDAIKITDLARELGLQIRGRQARCYNGAGHKNGDKNFSMGLDTKTNRYKCFACGVQGSVIDLYKEVKGVELSEAINDLAKMAGVQNGGKQAESKHQAPKATQTPAKTPTSEATGIYEALGAYCKGLDKPSFDYLTGDKRGLTPETIRKFKLFSVNDYKATNNYLHKSFTPEALQQAGIVSEKGNLIFFKHRIVIPFMAGERVIFLQGRRTDDEHPKYMHLKSSVPLFNADTLKTLATGERVYICEGVFDAMMLDQHGFKAVAILGVNNFKPEMAELFSGLDVVLCLDNDQHGQEATKQVAGIFSLQGQSVKTKRLPDGIKDITEFYLQ